MPSCPWSARGWSPVAGVHFDWATERKRNNNLTRLMNIDQRRGFQYFMSAVLCSIFDTRGTLCWSGMHYVCPWRFEEVRRRTKQLSVSCHTNALLHRSPWIIFCLDCRAKHKGAKHSHNPCNTTIKWAGKSFSVIIDLPRHLEFRSGTRNRLQQV